MSFFPVFSFDIVAVHVLVSVGQFRPEQDYKPSEVHPEHEQRYCSHGPVYHVQPGHEELRLQIQVLKDGECQSRYGCGSQGVGIQYFIIRYEFVHGGKGQCGHDVEQPPGQHGSDGFEIGYSESYSFQHVAVDDGAGKEQDYHKGGNEQYRDVEGYPLEDVPGFPDSPDIVEDPLHGNHHPEYEPYEQECAQKPHSAGLGGVNDVVGEAHDHFNGFLRVAEIGVQELLELVGQSETARDGENHSHERDYRHGPEKTQGHCLESYPFRGKSLDGDDKDLEVFYTSGLGTGKILDIQFPDIFRNEVLGTFQYVDRIFHRSVQVSASLFQS